MTDAEIMTERFESNGTSCFIQFTAPVTIKETVNDLHKATGLSRAYIYRDLMRRGLDSFLADKGIN
jgi:hypothetical protein